MADPKIRSTCSRSERMSASVSQAAARCSGASGDQTRERRKIPLPGPAHGFDHPPLPIRAGAPASLARSQVERTQQPLSAQTALEYQKIGRRVDEALRAIAQHVTM